MMPFPQDNMWVLALATLFVPCSSVTVDMIGYFLSSIPHFSVADITILCLDENSITHINNYAFSNLPSLTKLSICCNGIIFVADHAFQGTNISLLVLNDNKLTSVPNLGDIRDTLLYLILARNEISFVSPADFEGLNHLTALSIRNNPLSTLPDLHHLLPSIDYLGILSLKLTCCEALLWLKMKESLIPELDIDEFPCASPSYLVHVPWYALTQAQLNIRCSGELVS